MTNLSLIAKKRVGSTKEERSAKMRAIAILKHSKMTPAQKKIQADKMTAGRLKKKNNGNN